jgi:hypothetical protein
MDNYERVMLLQAQRHQVMELSDLENFGFDPNAILKPYFVKPMPFEEAALTMRALLVGLDATISKGRIGAFNQESILAFGYLNENWQPDGWELCIDAPYDQLSLLSVSAAPVWQALGGADIGIQVKENEEDGTTLASIEMLRSRLEVPGVDGRWIIYPSPRLFQPIRHNKPAVPKKSTTFRRPAMRRKSAAA